MAEFAVHRVEHVRVQVSDFPADGPSPPFRTVKLTIASDNGRDEVTLFTRNFDWKLEVK